MGIRIRPSRLSANSSRHQGVDLVLAGAGWSGATTFTLSGVAHVSILTTIVHNTSSARLVLTTVGASPGTLTISDGTNSGTVKIAALSPTRGRLAPAPPRPRRPGAT